MNRIGHKPRQFPRTRYEVVQRQNYTPQQMKKIPAVL